MTDYTIQHETNTDTYFVHWTGNINGPYKTRDSATRRIRKLRTMDNTEKATHIDAVIRAPKLHVESMTMPAQQPATPAEPDALPATPARYRAWALTGVYPGITKRAHQRRAYGA